MRALNRNIVLGSLIGLALIVSACSSGGGASAGTNEAQVSQSFSVDADVKVTVTTYNGTIEVRAGTDDKVQVEVTKRGGGDTDAEAKADLDNIQLSLAQAGGAVKLVATHKGRIPSNSAASFVVTVPSKATLSVSLGVHTKVVRENEPGVRCRLNNTHPTRGFPWTMTPKC